MIPTLTWTPEGVRFIDQTRLPLEESYVLATSYEQVADVIVTMVVRGAPAIGVSAAYGVALGAQKTTAANAVDFAPEFEKICARLACTRPTAVNLFWAIDRMKRLFARLLAAYAPIAEVSEDLLAEAHAMYDEDIAACKAMGAFGGELLPEEGGVLTHCNAGALATCGYGTALGVIRAAVEQGKRIHVYADETRPFLQGARLTAWELMADHIPTTVICDNMAASLMRTGRIQAVVVGADRIAANGDIANKIGTYNVAILAKEHGIPFYSPLPGPPSTWIRPQATPSPSRNARPSRSPTTAASSSHPMAWASAIPLSTSPQRATSLPSLPSAAFCELLMLTLSARWTSRPHRVDIRQPHWLHRTPPTAAVRAVIGIPSACSSASSVTTGALSCTSAYLLPYNP